ncbi:MAG: hypothetical protein ACREJ2_06660 [Planctomycetota bacterium]
MSFPPPPPPPTPSALALSPPARPGRIRLWLLLGLACFMLAIFKGIGGYLDFYEYMGMAEQLWLHGTLAAPPHRPLDLPESQLVQIDAELGPPPRYYRYPLGLTVLSGPAVWLGAGLQALSGGLISERIVLALTIPGMALLAVLLWLRIATDPRCGLCLSPRNAVLAAILLVLGTPVLTFTRLFYTEIATVLWALAVLYAWLRARHAAAAGEPDRRWWLCAGAALTWFTACHYADVFLAATLGVAMLLDLAGTRALSARARWARAALLMGSGLSGLAFLLIANRVRFGGALKFGYANHCFDGDISLNLVSTRVQYLTFYLLRVPWLAFAIGLLIVGRWRRPAALPAPATPVTADGTGAPTLAPIVRGGLAAAFLAQLCFWLTYRSIETFPLRYTLPMAVLGLPGLGLILHYLERRWPRFGAPTFTLAGAAWGLYCLVYFDCNGLPLISVGDNFMRPFRDFGAGAGWRCYTWYMHPRPTGVKAALAVLNGNPAGTPMGWIQILIPLVLAGAGTAALVYALRLAGRAERSARL